MVRTRGLDTTFPVELFSIACSSRPISWLEAELKRVNAIEGTPAAEDEAGRFKNVSVAEMVFFVRPDAAIELFKLVPKVDFISPPIKDPPPASIPPSFTPSDFPKSSLATTRRASIKTWRRGISILEMNCCTRSMLAAVSVTKTWLVRGSANTEPLALMMRSLDGMAVAAEGTAPGVLADPLPIGVAAGAGAAVAAPVFSLSLPATSAALA